MSTINGEDCDEKKQLDFFAEVAEASAKAVWCALATVAADQPRVRIVHPTWEGGVLWVATSPASSKSKQMTANSSLSMLKAHAIISRSWILAQINKKKQVRNYDRAFEFMLAKTAMKSYEARK